MEHPTSVSVSIESEEEFREILRNNITPTEPISDPSLLQGREAKLREIDREFNSRGAHIFIHGDRGVGKTSLALSAAVVKHPSSSEPPYICCDHQADFFELVRDMANQLLKRSPIDTGAEARHSYKLKVPGFAEFHRDSPDGTLSFTEQLKTVNEAVELLSAALEERGEDEPVLIIDEFDQLTNERDKRLFANLIKQVYDRRLRVRFIFCGIGRSLDAITGGHLSASRPIMPIALEPVTHDARWRIIQSAAGKLGFEVNQNMVVRIGQISDGFPYYVHLIGLSLFWSIFDHRDQGTSATKEDFATAVMDAIQKAESPLRASYELAMRKTVNSRDYEEVMWAVADGTHLARQIREIYDQSYLKIMKAQKKEPLELKNFRTRLYRLCDKAHGCILQKERNSWYHFSETVVRGFVRLQAQRNRIELGQDHF